MRATSDSSRDSTSSERASCPPSDDVAAFIDGALPPRARRTFEAHLAGCTGCRELVSVLCRGHGSDATDASSDAGSAEVGLASSAAVTLIDDGAARHDDDDLDVEPTLAPGTAIGRYTVLDRIGAGGMGVVYAAHDPELGRNVAIKLLRGDRAAADGCDALDDRLVHEARAMAQLAHPNVVAVFEIGRFLGRVFLVMELVEGQTLGHWLRDAPRSWRAIVEVFAAAGEGLAAAHAAGMVHRDFKPANVLVGRDGRVRVTDFGLVQDAARSSDRAMRAGTPSYMAPEQFRGEAPGARTDQFNFCVALYRALYNQRPFAGDTVAELAEEVAAGRVAPPPATARVPRWIGRAVLRGLATAPGDRHATIGDLLHALRRDPHRRLRRTALAAVAIAAAGVAAALLLRGAPAALGARCSDTAAERVAAVWGAASRQRVARAFAATDKPFAAAALAEVTRVLDRYAQRWTELRSDLCETSSDRPGSGDQLAGLRALCLDRRLGELRAFVAALSDASAGTVQRAAGAAHGLTELDDCADPRALLAPVPPPADPAALAAIAALRDQLADAKVLHRLGRFADARDHARALLPAVLATHDRSLEAETQLAIGMAAFESGDYDGLEPALKAAAVAGEASRSDAVAVRALIYVMFYQGVLQGHYDQAARDLAPRALAIIERRGGDAELEGQLRVALSWTWLGASRFADAEREGKRALELLEQRFGTSDIRITPALYARISSSLAQADTATAVGLARRMLAIRIQVLGDDHPETAAAHQHLGVALEHTPSPGDARAELARAQAVYERTLGASHPEMTDVYRDLASYDAAMGHMAAALAYARRALAIAEKTSGTHSRQYGQMQLVIARLLADLDRDGEALAVLDQAQAALRPTAEGDDIEISDQQLTAAVVLGHLGRHAEARRDAEASLAILDRLLGPHHVWSALRHGVLGELDLATRRPREALADFERAASVIDHNDGSLARSRADIAFGTARALAALGREPQRARALAESARAAYAAWPELSAQRSRIDGWLARHPAPPP